MGGSPKKDTPNKKFVITRNMRSNSPVTFQKLKSTLPCNKHMSFLPVIVWGLTGQGKGRLPTPPPCVCVFFVFVVGCLVFLFLVFSVHLEPCPRIKEGPFSGIPSCSNGSVESTRDHFVRCPLFWIRNSDLLTTKTMSIADLPVRDAKGMKSMAFAPGRIPLRPRAFGPCTSAPAWLAASVSQSTILSGSPHSHQATAFVGIAPSTAKHLPLHGISAPLVL